MVAETLQRTPVAFSPDISVLAERGKGGYSVR